MADVTEILSRFESITKTHDALEAKLKKDVGCKSDELEPLVKKHFDTYVAEKIAPMLPQGFAIGPATSAKYVLEQRGFVIVLGEVTMPEGVKRLPAEIGNKVEDLISEYEMTREWVATVVSTSLYPPLSDK